MPDGQKSAVTPLPEMRRAGSPGSGAKQQHGPREAAGPRAEVRAAYFAEEGLDTALRDALKSLFAEPRLPDNPYNYLAAALSAFVDQGPLWKAPDAALLEALDGDGGIDVVDGHAALCKLASCESPVLGLPHVLRAVSREGAVVMLDCLSNSLPDSFFPGPMPSSTRDGYSLQVLSSVQGPSALWRPSWLEFPELAVRADVVVRGPQLQEALALFAQLLASDVADLEGVPLNFVDGLRVVPPLGAPLARAKAAETAAEGGGGSGTSRAAAAAAAAAATQPGSAGAGGGGGRAWGLAEMAAQAEEFRQVVSRAVLSSSCFELRAVVMLDAPANAEHPQDRRLRFEVATKRYAFHFVPTPSPEQPDGGGGAAPAGRRGPAPQGAATSYSAASVQAQLPQHYGSAPHEALFEGYFLNASAAKQYLGLFAARHGPPYGAAPRMRNTSQLAHLVEADLQSGATLEGFRRLLLLVLLQDGSLLQPGPLDPSSIVPLEDLLLSRPPATQADMLLSTVPNLLRMLNSGAGAILGIVREMEAVRLVSERWPARRDSYKAQAAAAAAAAGGAESPGSSGRRQTQGPVQESQPAAMLAWLDGFQMEGRVLQQLLGLRPRVLATTGGGVFAGISTILARLLAELPDKAPPAAECGTVLAGSAGCVDAMQQLIEAAALTLADALLDRCRDVLWALRRFGVRLVDAVAARAVPAGGGEPAAGALEWVLHVASATDAQVGAGAVPERVASEGVMLQYAVDTKLDGLLSSFHSALSEPPLPVNPFPKLLALVRAHAARLDLWREDVDEVCSQLLNRLSLLDDPPGFLYAATPPDGAGRARRRRHGAAAAAVGANGDDEEEAPTVFGSYAAVTICDCGLLQSAAASLGGLLAERRWQKGGYSADVLPALAGDAWLTGALALGEGGEEPLALAGGRQAGWGAARAALGAAAPAHRSPFSHPRFYRLETEEHHQVAGPELGQAAALFAASVVDYALELHGRSQHLVTRLRISGGDAFTLQQLLAAGGREAAVYSLLAAVRASAAADGRPWPLATCADDCLAVLELLAAAKDGPYVPVTKRMHFAWRGAGLPLDTASAGAAAHRAGSALAPRFVLPAGSDGASDGCAAAPEGPPGSSPAAEAAEPHWGAGVYRRVFLTEGAARAWQAWNRGRGDPAQPYHAAHLLGEVQQQLLRLEASSSLLDAQKLLLLAGAAAQDIDLLVSASRAMQSAAQELRCLRDANTALALLLAADAAPAQRAKTDAERVRAQALTYCARLRRAMASPKYSYFSGLAAAAPRLILQVRDAALGGAAAGAQAAGGGPSAAAALATLGLWTHACELSVAAAVHDCFDPDAVRRLAECLAGLAGGVSLELSLGSN